MYEIKKQNKTETCKGSPGASVVKNLPARAVDVGLIPAPGRSHMLCSHKLVYRDYRACSRPRTPVRPEPVLRDTGSHGSEKPAQHKGVAPARCQLEKSPCSNEDRHSPKISKIKNI